MQNTFSFALSFAEAQEQSCHSSSEGVNGCADQINSTPLYQCAESKIYACDFYGVAAICKHRFAKAYRHKALDSKLREQRTVREARALARCHKAGIRVPVVFGVERRSCKIFMERIAGITVKDALDVEHAKMEAARRGADPTAAAAAKLTAGAVSEKEKSDTPTLAVAKLLRGIGEMVGLMHNLDVIHGDLTTSNFLTMGSSAPSSCDAVTSSATPHHASDRSPMKDRDGLVVIDLGLVSDKNSPEERAVDLYVLERAITSTHPFVERFAADVILQGYERTVDPKKGKATMARLEAVRARGRKRSMVG